jgi:hypothetical protein
LDNGCWCWEELTYVCPILQLFLLFLFFSTFDLMSSTASRIVPFPFVLSLLRFSDAFVVILKTKGFESLKLASGPNDGC